MFESESFTILFYGNPLTPYVGCAQMAVTVTMVTENVYMSRRFKAELVTYGICLQPLSRLSHL
jgi:hypothetical protein